MTIPLRQQRQPPELAHGFHTVVGDARVHTDRGSRPHNVLQLFDRLLAHVLQLGHVVVHVGNLHLARGAGAAGGHDKAFRDGVAGGGRPPLGAARGRDSADEQAERGLAPRQQGF